VERAQHRCSARVGRSRVPGPSLSATRASPTSINDNPLAVRGPDDEPNQPDSGVDVRSTIPQRWLPVRLYARESPHVFSEVQRWCA
jgi:hypothetical protein